MTMHQVVSRLLPDRESECVVPDACMTDVCDDLGIRVTRTVINGVHVPEKDGRWVGALRRIVATKLRTWGLEESVDDAQLLASELLTNALRYGDQASDIGFRLLVTSKAITIAVNGCTSYRPRAVQTDDENEGGRGLFLVSVLASAWGVGDDGTTTWCMLRRPGTEVPGC